jgi:hypothetical protein
MHTFDPRRRTLHLIAVKWAAVILAAIALSGCYSRLTGCGGATRSDHRTSATPDLLLDARRRALGH